MRKRPLERLEELFQAAADLPVAERATFLDRECASAPALRERLELMLEQMDRDETLEAPSKLENRVGHTSRVGVSAITRD